MRMGIRPLKVINFFMLYLRMFRIFWSLSERNTIFDWGRNVEIRYSINSFGQKCLFSLMKVYFKSCFLQII